MSTLNNAVLAMLADNEKFKFVSVTFPASTKLYHYKTNLLLQAGDTVLVNTQTGLKAAEAVELIDYLDMATTDSMEYKWIVQLVDTTEYDKVVAVELELVKALRTHQRKRMKEQATAALFESLGEAADEIKKLIRL
jgi:hypothetical protein